MIGYPIIMKNKIILPFVKTLHKRFQEPSPLIQVIIGPRQVGKTTGVLQFLETYQQPYHFANADDLIAPGREWLTLQWQEAKRKKALLVIDEIQKISNWSETIKKFWDDQKRLNQNKISILLLGSSSLNIQKGLTESLTGRYELIPVFHWNYLESIQLKEMTIDEYLQFGGYPGSYTYLADTRRWHQYMVGSIIEPVINRDILAFANVKNPTLFRQSFEIISGYPAQEISFRKLLGQLHEKGNTDQIKYYLDLFAGAFLFKSLEKYSAKNYKVKSSSPKILPMCSALFKLSGQVGLQEKIPHMFEASVGAALARGTGKLYYWRQGNYEVDFIYLNNNKLYAIEVKSGRKRKADGLEEFQKHFKSALPVIVTRDNYQDFIKNPEDFLLSVSS